MVTPSSKSILRSFPTGIHTRTLSTNAGGSSIGGFMADLKLRIASTLTSSLSPKDREKLLDNLGVQVNNVKVELDKQNEESQQKIRSSIGEAVAAELAKEASKSKKLMEAERERIWKQAEKATMERIQNDLLIEERRIKLEKWKQELEREKMQEKKIISAADSSKQDEKKHYHHPVLGPTLYDLGYKRIHIVSAKTLSAIPIWEKQRSYRHDRAKVMANDKMKSLGIGLPGVISIHENTEGELGILDGQHRVGMMTILSDRVNNDSSSIFDKVLVEVFPQHASSNENHAQDIFLEINKAEPVKLVDMPGIAKISDRKIINQAADTLCEAYPEMFKPSQRCRPPHLNIDNLRDAIFAAGVLNRHSFKSQKALAEWMMKQNQIMGEKIRNSPPPNLSSSAINKARQYDFYLGLDLSWLYM
jgi:hypothetical protein